MTNPYRHPGGRTCRGLLLIVAVVMMPYALIRYALDVARGSL